MLEHAYFRAINGGLGGASRREIELWEAKTRLRAQLTASFHYVENATRNGVPQGFIVTSGDNPYKAKIEALPDDELCTGDLICTGEDRWIIWRVKTTNPLQKIGTGWLCNFEFRWQNGTPKIIKRWGVFDSGVYSSTRDGDKTAMTADKQFRVFLPYDKDTAKLAMDKRLATGTVYNKEGRKVLNVQRITGVDPVSNSYGAGGHLLVLNTRSDDYVATNDSLELMICDYIAPGPLASRPDFRGRIVGEPQIRLGGTRIYTASFDVAEWQVSECEGVVYEAEGNTLSLCADRNEELLGEEISVTALNADGKYARIFVEVVE